MKKRRFMKSLMVWLLAILLATQTFTAVAFPNGYELPENGSTVADVGEEYYTYPEYEYLEEKEYEEYKEEYVLPVPLAATFYDGQIIVSETFEVSDNLELVYASQYGGDYSSRFWEPEYCVRTLEAQAFAPARARIGGPEHLFDYVIRSAGVAGVPTVGNMSIESVQVMIGGSYQVRYRGQVNHGPTVYQGPSGNFYTTARAAALTDPRLFTIRTEVDASLIDDPLTFLHRVSYTYGNRPFSEWIGGSPHFDNAGGPRLLQLASHSLIYDSGTFTLETRVIFNSPYAGAGPFPGGTANPINWHPYTDLPVNQPFLGYRGIGQAGFPLAMRHVVGLFDFDVRVAPPAGGEGQVVGRMPIRLNLYDDFFLWSEIEEWALDLRDEAGPGREINGRFVEVNIIGYSQQGRPIYNIVVASSQAAVEHYFNVTRPLKMTNPMALRAEVEAGVQHRLPIYHHNIHPDEVTGVCSQLIMIEQLIWEPYLIYETINAGDTTERIRDMHTLTEGNNHNFVMRTTTNTSTVTICTDEALEHFIFVFTPTNNPDGRYMLRRANAYGFDLNRDAAFQTQPENIYVMADVIKWAPAIVLEFHGHVAALLIEPCSPPHNPNYEYDLMQPFMLRMAHEMGRAAISGAYNRYMIPAEHRTRGWDDASVVYFPMYAALFGALGYVLEIPHANQDSFYANIAMGWATVNYSIKHFEELFFNKLEQHYRGINNIDARDLVDHFFVNPWHVPNQYPHNVIGRPRIPLGGGLYKDFFPDYWVIPIGDDNQRNKLEAYRMVERLLRQDIQVDVLAVDVTHDGVTYPAGTFIIDMRQPFRGAVNAIMSTPADISMFAALFAEQTIDFPNLRGFNAASIWSPDLFDGLTTPLLGFSIPTAQLPAGASPYVIISNNNDDAIRIVNDLLRAGADVYMLASPLEGSNLGDFITARSNMTPAVLGGRFVEMRPLESVPEDAAGPLVQPRVALLHGGHGVGQGLFATGRYTMRSLGFDYVWAQSNAELAALDRNYFNIMFAHNVNWSNMLTIANDGVPIVAVQATAAAAVDTLFATPVTAVNLTASREGLFRGSYSATSILTGNHVTHDTVYIIGGRTYTVIPVGATPLVRTASGAWDDVFLGGFFHDPGIAGGNQANSIDRILAYTGITAAGYPATVFGSNILNRAHTRAFDNIFASAIFMNLIDLDFTALKAAINAANALTESHWTAASWANMQTALTAAQAALTATTQDQIDDATAALNTARNALVRVGQVGGTGPGTPGAQPPPQPPAQDIEDEEVPLDPGDEVDYRFRDVNSGHWFYNAVNYVYENSIMRGVSDDLFAPNASFNRAMAATVLFRMAGAEASFVQVFDDVAAGQWYSEAITWAAENGIVLGIGNNLFDPYANVTREQLAAMFFRYATFMEFDMSTSELTGFVDIADVSYWALEAMSWAVHHEIIQGVTGNRLNPRGTATRAECATIIMRMMTTFN